MFDVGFSEVLLLGIIALLVLGPERLPKAARIFGGFVRKARRSFEGLKQEIEREIDADELRKSLAAMPTVASMTEQINAPFKGIADAIENERQNLSQGFDTILSEAEISADLMGEAPKADQGSQSTAELAIPADDNPPRHPRAGGDPGEVSDAPEHLPNLGSRLRGNSETNDTTP